MQMKSLLLFDKKGGLDGQHFAQLLLDIVELPGRGWSASMFGVNRPAPCVADAGSALAMQGLTYDLKYAILRSAHGLGIAHLT